MYHILCSVNCIFIRLIKTLARAYICQFASLTYILILHRFLLRPFSLCKTSRGSTRNFSFMERMQKGDPSQKPTHSLPVRPPQKRTTDNSPASRKRTTQRPGPAPGDDPPGSPAGAGSSPAAPRAARSPCSRRLRLQNLRVGKGEPISTSPLSRGKNEGRSQLSGGYFLFVC